MTPSESILFSLEASQAVRHLLQKYGFAAKKSWGQNFLVSDAVYQSIVEASVLDRDTLVVEIGAGLGTLTARLLQTGAQVVAIEREADMCQVLRTELGMHPRFVLREENALTTDLQAIFQNLNPSSKPMVLVGNLPYQISSQLLFHALSSKSIIRTMIFMLQREVAERLLASPDTPSYGALSAQVQMLAQVRRVRNVSPAAFLPQPKVDSTIVRLTPFPTTRVPVKDLEVYQKIVKAAFSMRRKTLRNTLKPLLQERTESILSQAQIDPNRRGETLSIEEFARMADKVPASIVSKILRDNI